MIDGTVGPRRRLRVICLAAGVLLSATGVLAQGRVTGSVKSQDGQPLKGAMIIGNNPLVAPPTRTATSDAKGRFAFMALGKGEWTFTIDAPGYEQSKGKLIVRLMGNNPSLDVVLHVASDLPPTGPMANVDVAALQQRLDEAAADADAGKLDAAIAMYREIAAKFPPLTMVHLQLGALQERKQDLAAATAEYRIVLKSEPDNVVARAALDRLGAAR
jgi:Carboxypeptidase regulatory-like domain